MTRYGKSYWVAAAIGLYIFLNKKKRVKIIGPQLSQALIIKRYLDNWIMRSKDLTSLLKDDKGVDLTKQTTKNRITFKNGVEVACVGAHGDAKGAMGEGGHLNIVDELGLIQPETWSSKIHRMLGDGPKDSQFVGLFNPWPTENIAKDLWEADIYERFHVGYKEAIEEGRQTQEFIDDVRNSNIDEVDFIVLYESKFPKGYSTSIVDPEGFNLAMKRDIQDNSLIIDIGCDVARQGDDKIEIGVRKGYQWIHNETWGKKKLPFTIGRLTEIGKFYLDKGFRMVRYWIDDGGLSGCADGVEENFYNEHRVYVFGINNGSTAIKSDKYFNLIAELWFWVADNIDYISVPNDRKLREEFTKRKFFYVSKGQKRLESKEDFKKRLKRSPDKADMLCYAYAAEVIQPVCNKGGDPVAFG